MEVANQYVYGQLARGYTLRLELRSYAPERTSRYDGQSAKIQKKTFDAPTCTTAPRRLV